jgi:hypothetical protein
MSTAPQLMPQQISPVETYQAPSAIYEEIKDDIVSCTEIYTF